MAWRKRGGVMLLGYEMFRLLTLPRRIHPSASTPAHLNSLDEDAESVTSSISSKSGRSRKSKKVRADDLMEEDLTNDSIDDQIQMYTGQLFIIYDCLDFREVLLDPGPDVIICDEGHRIKNSEASISKALKAIRTKRRVVLTGYPIQNNLMEYWCMVDFVRPNFLGTKQEFTGMFMRPIDNGQCIDSTNEDHKLMQGRAHVLHELLQGFVQRRSHAVLKASLPEKSEVVLLVKLSPLQRVLYRAFMQSLRDSNSFSGSNTLKTYAMCCKIWNHPDILWHVMENYGGSDTEDFDELLGPNYGSTPSSTKAKKSRKSTAETTDKSTLNDPYSDCGWDDFSDLPGPAALYRSKAYISAQKRAAANSSMHSQSSSDLLFLDGGDNSDQTRFGGSLAAQRQAAKMFHQKMAMLQNIGTYDWATNDTLWPKDYVPGELAHGGKIVLFMRILEASLARGDKVLAFSQSLFTLDLLERLLQSRRCPMFPQERELIDKTDQILANTCPGQNEKDASENNEKYTHAWKRNHTYFRLDGSTSGSERERMIDEFNDMDNPSRLFLMSTRAGCLGINLVAANRVIVLDASWNPCHDCQAVCRIYRYGQKKNCHIYRLISDNTMEKKIYDRQVTKQGMSDRVVDELNPTQQFTRAQVEVLIDYQDMDQPTLTQADLVQAKELMDQDSVLRDVLPQSRDWVTKCPFTHESLLIDQKDYRLTKVEKRLARQHYEAERRSTLRSSKANELHMQQMLNLQRIQRSLTQSNIGELGSVNLDTIRNNLASQLSRSHSSELDQGTRTLSNGAMIIDPQRFNPIIQKLRQEDGLNRVSMLQPGVDQARSRQSGTSKRKSRPESRDPFANGDIVLPEIPMPGKI
ncbi:hypothetical protein Ciccas_001554 [Cichlidogyrus casuarinus]|uniref:Helicase C-terminal domain-containing protein n=1 Tax=Cichlidogyrus casuarinus TaxID=1844966 RepID=A0ABD2QMU8_9PLAT